MFSCTLQSLKPGGSAALPIEKFDWSSDPVWTIGYEVKREMKFSLSAP